MLTCSSCCTMAALQPAGIRSSLSTCLRSFRSLSASSVSRPDSRNAPSCPEDAWVVLIALDKDGAQQVKRADIAREGVVLLLNVVIQPLEDGVVIFLVALLREFARPEHVAVRQSFEMALIRMAQLRAMGQHLHTVTGGIATSAASTQNTMTLPSQSDSAAQAKYRATSGFAVISSRRVGAP